MDLVHLPGMLMGYIVNVALAILIFVFGRWLAGKLIAIIVKAMEHHEVEPTVTNFVKNIAYVALLIFVIIAALAQLGIPTASFVAIVGAAGLAIGLALQGSLSNFASGILLVLFHPIKLGDYIEAGGVSGTVQEINIFSITLITPDRRTITVPNSLVLGGPIINYSTSDKRRIDLMISVTAENNIASVKELIEKVVRADQRILTDKKLTIGVMDMNGLSIDLAVRPWVVSKDYMKTKFDLQEAIKNALDQAGIKMPYPQLERARS